MPYSDKKKRNEYNKIYYLKNKDFLNKKSKVYKENNPDKVKKSQKKYYLKNRESINNNRRIRWKNYYNTLDGIKKEKERKKEYYLKNKDKIAEKGEIYRENNKEKIRERHRIWYQENKEEINRKVMEKRKSDKFERIRFNTSALVRGKLKRRLGGKNGKSTFSCLPYTVDKLISHLENLFQTGMCWNNYGKERGMWNIDHKIPDCKFDYNSVDDINFQKSWALENLQPMWAEDNWKKNRF